MIRRRLPPLKENRIESINSGMQVWKACVFSVGSFCPHHSAFTLDVATARRSIDVLDRKSVTLENLEILTIRDLAPMVG